MLATHSKKINPQKTVVELAETRIVELPPTDRLDGAFMVLGDRLFAKNYYGNLGVYDLRDGKKVSDFHFRPGELSSMASDGERLCLCLNSKNDFELRDSDVLLARQRDDPDDEITHFVGKPVGELYPGRYNRVEAKDRGIAGVIISLPLSSATVPGIVWDPMLAGSESTRFLIHGDMSMVGIYSWSGYVWVAYNYHMGEGGCGARMALKGDEVYDMPPVIEPPKRKLPEGLEISARGYGPHPGVEASFVDIESDPEQYSAIEDPEKEEPEVMLNVVYRGQRPVANGILGSHHDDDAFHILYNSEAVDYTGISKIYRPHRLVTYTVALRMLVADAST
ncbi:MAG: hypothetical protein HYW25_03110 [Candidatus Aenigmarchaeota archaeon]|nr:hypothetical protein [Candidatus Aenigmarchaeota archaeon]